LRAVKGEAVGPKQHFVRLVNIGRQREIL